MTAYEVNFDGLIGPTHHYGGLSQGNLASQQHRLKKSFPRRAALEGLQKMKLLADLGLPQGVLPPHERPDVVFLRRHGFSRTDSEVIQQAAKQRIDLLSIASSASAMWAANAATVSPSADTADQRVHITPANLVSNVHRQLEPEFTTKLLRKIFTDTELFCVHNPLPDDFPDEGAANHSRLCKTHHEAGVELFVYGSDGSIASSQKFNARQSRSASEAIATQHQLAPQRTTFLKQNPRAIDAGVFHNDVIAVVNENVLLCHELAFFNQSEAIRQIRKVFPELSLIEVKSSELSLQDAVQTYLFNSQLVTRPDAGMLLLCPIECETHQNAKSVIDRILEETNQVTEVRFIDVRQSMQNGGGPACLRLRVVLTEEELNVIHQPILLTEALYDQLTRWVKKHYREELTIESLCDPQLLFEVRSALNELSDILELGPIYSFQS